MTTTLDTDMQKVAEKWVKAATIVPHTKDPAATAKRLGLTYEPWMRNLTDKNLRNGALVAQDYQTGEVIAYVGSADYYARTGRPEFQPQYDVAGKGYRQPGSAFKPFNYAIGIDERRITAGSMIMDASTDFGGGFSPANADRLERGPVRVRTALQFSLNIPSVKVGALNGKDHVFAKAREFGMGFQTETTNAGLSLALGVQEVRPVDLVSAYGALANGGKAIGHTTILTVKDTAGEDVADPYVPPAGAQVVSPQAAYIVTDILAGNTVRSVNPFWGKFAITGPDGRRPATLKTGTNTDAKDLNAYGYIAPPTPEGREAGAYALVVGAWNGNSDNTLVSTPSDPLFSIDVTDLRLAGLHQRSDGQVARDQLRPAGRSDPRRDRRLHWHARGTGFARRGGVVHRGHGATGSPGARHVRHGRLRGRQRRARPAGLDGCEQRLDPTRATGTWHGRRPGPDPRQLLLQQRLPALRVVVGRHRRQDLGLRRAEPVADLFPGPDTGPERGDPVLRDPVTVGVRGDRGTPLPHAVSQSIGESVGDPAGDTDAHARGDADADTGRDADPDTGADTNADPHPDPGRRGGPARALTAVAPVASTSIRA